MTTFEENISTANVLAGNKKYLEAIQSFTKAVEKTSIPEQRIDIYNTIGKLYLSSNDLNNAIQSFEKSLEIHRNLSKEKATDLKVNKAVILNNLGVISLKSNTKKAISCHKEALQIFKDASELNPDNFIFHTANTHYSYGDACYLHKDYFMAKKQYKEAIAVYESLEEHPSIQPLIANSYYNLGNIYTDEDNVFDARNNYLKALKIFRVLAEDNPESYKSLVAATFNNLAVTAKTMYKFDDAIVYYENALKEYEYLIEIDRTTFLPFYASTLNSIGIVYTEQHEVKDDYASEGLSGFSGFGTLSAANIKDEKKEKAAAFQKEKAVEFYLKAEKAYSELVTNESETYSHYIATIHHNLGVLYDSKKDFEQAEDYYQKALTTRRYLAKDQPKAFNLDTCVTLLNITTMYQNLLEQTGDIRLKTESLKILKELEERLNVYGNTEKPLILHMKSNIQYFSQYFKGINKEFLAVSEAISKADAITEKITETIIPSEKLKLQKHIVNLLYILRVKYPDNERLQVEILNTYIQYSWFALRSNKIALAEKALEGGFKINPDSLTLKANQAHVHLVKNENDEAKEIYSMLKSQFNTENESFKKVLEKDIEVLKKDGVLKSDIDLSILA